MRKHLPVIAAYTALLMLALPVPLVHHFRTDRAIEARRPALRLDDGSYTPMLMPSHLIGLRYFGRGSWAVPIIVSVMFVLSFWLKQRAQFEILLALAVAQCAFTTLYALYAILVFTRNGYSGLG